MTVFGNWEELDVDIFDFKRKPIEEDTTVIELYEKTANYFLIDLLSFYINVPM